MFGKVCDIYIYDILGLENKCLQKNSLVPKSNIFSFFNNKKLEMQNVKNQVHALSDMNLQKYASKYEELQSLLQGFSGQFYMHSQSLKGKTPEQIEEILKEGYSLYTKVQANNQKTKDEYIVDEHGYRMLDVAFVGRDVLLRRNDDNIKKAMENLTTDISNLVNNAQNLTDSEYITEVAKLHYRYILIHPFRDSNGRIGRNLINQMLAEKNKMFVLEKQDKSTYLNIMNNMITNIPNPTYLHALSSNPDYCRTMESKYANNLARIYK